jgi:hypothetical protein
MLFLGEKWQIAKKYRLVPLWLWIRHQEALSVNCDSGDNDDVIEQLAKCRPPRLFAHLG